MAAGISESYRREGELRVEERLQLQDLQELMFWFKKHKPPEEEEEGPAAAVGKRRQARQAGLLSPEEFKETMQKVLGTREYDNQLDTLFTKLDTSCDGYVDWNEFCTYMLLQFKENDFIKSKVSVPFQTDPKIRHLVHNRQETTSKVVFVDNPMKYVVISKEGNMSILDHNLHFESYTNMAVKDDLVLASQKRKIHYWVTDAVYMPNCRKIAVSSTGRDIRFFDMTSNNFIQEFHLFSIPVIPNCMDYWYDAKLPGEESRLVYGDDAGGLAIMYFKKPMHQLFSTPFNRDEGVQKVFYPDLCAKHATYVRHVYISDVHSESVGRVLYVPENNFTFSSSASSRESLVAYDHDRKKKAYTWRLSRGVECFDFKKRMNIVVTGSTDHLVRMWNPYVTSKPTAILEGHYMAVIDTRIYEAMWVILSYSRDMAIKVWDIKEQYCLQTVFVRFPSSLLGRMPEYGPNPMLLQISPSRKVLAMAGDYIAQLKLGQLTTSFTDQELTHPLQLCAALYNPLFKTVVTGADDSSVIIWDIETGAKSLLFTNTHGTEEVTCMCLDQSWRRLFTGAGDGSIKVWNVQNGHNLHEYEVVEEAEVTGILPMVDRRQVLVVGWNRKLLRFDDSDVDTHYVRADVTWKGGHVHRDDILTIAHLPPNLVATGSFDGEINVWNLETESLFIRLRQGRPTSMNQAALAELLRMLLRPLTGQSTRACSQTSRSANQRLSAGGVYDHGQLRPSSKSRSSRPNSRHRAFHKFGKGQQAPVEKLLFLQSRVKTKKRNEAAILLSSEAGNIHFWSIYGEVTLQAVFYAAVKPDESVLCLTTSPEDVMLVTGDTFGYVSIWDLRDYATAHAYEVTDEPPPLLHRWEANEGFAIVSVDHVTHDVGQFVVTASVDCTARLFTLDGTHVGTFGQKKLWNLFTPNTWAGVTDDESEELMSTETLTPPVTAAPEAEREDTGTAVAEPEPGQLTGEVENLQPTRTKTYIGEDLPDGVSREMTLDSIPTLERGDTLVDDSVTDEAKLQNTTASTSAIPILPKIKSHTAAAAVCHERRSKRPSYGTMAAKALSVYIENPLKGRYKRSDTSDSITLPNGARRKLIDAHKSFLGASVEDRFYRISENRKGRREFKEHLNLPEVNRMGKLCCPYQAMVIPKMEEISVPRHLPLSQRMLKQGVTSESLTLRDILTRPEKSFYATDSSVSEFSEPRRHKTSVAFSDRRSSVMSGPFTRGRSFTSHVNKRHLAAGGRKESRATSTLSNLSYQKLQ